DFVLRWFAQGDAAVPAEGMGAIPGQLAATLPPESIHLNRRVASLARDGADFIVGFGGDAEPIRSRQLILAVEEPAARKLLAGIGLDKRIERRGPMRGVTAMYFAAPTAPMAETMLMLNGDGPSAGPVNNLAIMSEVSRAYAPEGQSLISISIVGIPDLPQSRLEDEVRAQMRQWFGAESVDAWSHLATYRIHHALPDQGPPALEPVIRTPELAEGLYLAGDYRETGSIHGAMHSGRMAGIALARSAAAAF
ncbi:MAG: FAD-dependent oxidoreductase, partial [Alphaproteobacteria bacterium]